MKTLIKKIKGENKKGNSILIIAGVHGEEITPIYTLSVFLRDRVNELLKDVKSITVVNGINMSGLESGTREIQSKHTSDLNRMFDYETHEDSFETLKELIDKNDIVIDLHSSPSCANFALIDIDEYANSMMKWCEKANVITSFRYSGASTIKRYCLDKGKPALTIELNKLNTIDHDSAHRGVNILSNLIYSSAEFAKIEKKDPKNITEMVEIKTHISGLLDFHNYNGQSFEKGQILYSIMDLELNIIYDYEAKFDGVIICEPSKSFVKRGDVIYLVQPE